MKVLAYVLIEAEPGLVKDIIDQLSKVKGVKEAAAVTGPYDIIASVSARNMESLGDLITKKVQVLSGIRKTITCLASYSVMGEA